MEMGKRVATGRNWSGIFMVLVGVVVIAGLSYSVGLNNGDAKDSIERGGEIPIGQRLDSLEARMNAVEKQMPRSVQTAEPSVREVEGKSDLGYICDYSIGMQYALLRAYNMELCRAIHVSELYRLEALEVGHPDFRADDFANMPNLKSLSLSTLELPNDVFRHLSGLTNLKMVVGDSAAFWQRDFATELPNLEHLQFETFGEEIGWGTWNFRIDLRFTDFGVCGEHKSLPSEDEEKWSVKKVHTDIVNAIGSFPEC